MQKTQVGRQTIQEHEGHKYLRKIYAANGIYAADGEDEFLWVDVYQVLEAFDVECSATQHAIKKLLCAGERSKGSRLEDLKGAFAAINRAIDIQEQRQRSQKKPK